MIINGVDDLMYFGVLLSVAVRWAVSRFPYSGAGKPPMFGDYEAQRHWMEITVNLPTHEWYKNSTKNDLLYWGLDYPPLTAYHSMICGYIAKWFNPDWVALNTSRGYESYHHKIFMRSTVVGADVVFYVALIVYWTIVYKPWNFRNKAIAAGLCLLYPGLILIDHGHFQYNSVSLGFTLWAIISMMSGHDLIGAAFFCLALHYKQMSLYYALPFFCYLLGTCLKLPWTKRIAKFLKLSCVVLIVSGICWMPFLRSLDDTLAVVERLFPFSRGLYEDKVANIWCMLSVVIKWKSLFSTPTLVKISAFCTLLAVLPSSIQLLRNPSLHKLRLSLINSSLAFFLFSFQVHEKTILLPALPILLLLEDYPLPCVWFAYISTFSLVPLLAKDGLMIPFVALSALFLIGAIRGYEDLLLSLKTQSSRYASLSFCISVLGSIALVVSMFTIKQPARYPHLHVLLNCIYSGIHFVGFLLYFNYLQFIEIPYNIYCKKIKYN
ncbi:dolichyl pyrophosphate Man9GlcNAc2 alpha-1,3-glucosyltransferase-like [Argiope bruennichi]|uniref:dolichyl pyrophosphate Man9GlcNAc2 alpha-1,3-glucosyltransferase-like n=1 Tax=Argiope bruennichi TaxID=94029 RepID=UPI0024946E6A|nr:dolichyl pyrophosphate Man9GlcNAc2 alpha-1,3-glucosyltransferase-like [Argiope bruennichi]